MVIGRTGSGKSALLQGLLGEIPLTNGWSSMANAADQEKNQVAYASQSAWIMNATLRDNILFGNEYDERRYNAVIDACGLW